MDVSTLPDDMRRSLYDVLKQFRTSENLDAEGYRNRNLLEQKLLSGGFLNELDMYVLVVAVANVAPDWHQSVRQLFGM